MYDLVGSSEDIKCFLALRSKYDPYSKCSAKIDEV